MLESACDFFLAGVVLDTTGALEVEDEDDDNHVGKCALVVKVVDDDEEEEDDVEIRDMTGGVDTVVVGDGVGLLAAAAGESLGTSVLTAMVFNPPLMDCNPFMVPITINAMTRRYIQRKKVSAD